MSDETNAGERELLWEIKVANEQITNLKKQLETEYEETLRNLLREIAKRDTVIMDLREKLAEALARWEQQNPPTVSGSVFAVDLDNPLAEGLVLECLDRKVLAATARHYHAKALRWKGEALKRTIALDDAKVQLAKATGNVTPDSHDNDLDVTVREENDD